jgi:hypothetical protein
LNLRPSGYEPDELTELLHPAVVCGRKCRCHLAGTPIGGCVARYARRLRPQLRAFAWSTLDRL